MNKNLLTMMCLLLSFNASALVLKGDTFRSEVKQLTLKNHQNLKNYTKARKDVMQILDLKSDNRGYFIEDVYCQKTFRKNIGPTQMPHHGNINIEHTWPRSRFGVGKGSRKYKVMEADLHHLYPTDSNSNSTRGNFVFTEFDGQGRDVSHKCHASQRGFKPGVGQAFEPPHEHKGNVARALFYMAVRYDLKISKSEEFFLRQWHLIDPVDAEEIKRNDGVENIQGNRNPFVDDADLVNLISNF